MGSRLEELKQRIEDAFAEVPYPGDGNIGYDPKDWEGAEMNEHFRGRHWKDVPRDTLLYHQHDLAFFSAAGFRYYLPTYLFAGLEDFGDTLSFTILLLQPNEGELREHWSKRSADFSPAQKQAVWMWLKYVRDEMQLSLMTENIDAALKHWERD